jgi:hypothetical protein
MPLLSNRGKGPDSTPCRALHTYIGLTTADSTGGASGCGGQGVVNRARRRSRPRGFHPFCNPTSPVKLGPFFDPHPDIRRLLRSRPSHNSTVVRLPDSNGPGQPSRDCGAAVPHIVCAVGGARTLPWYPSKNKIGLPIFARGLAARLGGPPFRFSSRSPSPGLADGQGFMRGFCAEPLTNRRIMSDGRKIAAESKEIVFVQLSKLKKSPRTCGGFRTPRPRLSRLRQASARSACFNRRLSPRSGRATNRPATIWSLGGTPACAVAPRKAQGDQRRRADPLRPRCRA